MSIILKSAVSQLFIRRLLCGQVSTSKNKIMAIPLAQIPTWEDYAKDTSLAKKIDTLPHVKINNSLNAQLCKKVSLLCEDITKLQIDAIVNAANTSLMGGGGVDGCIHKKAGSKLVEECKTLNGCPAGEAKITKGYNLPAKHVIHTVGPRGEKTDVLTKCYENTLKIMLDEKLRTIAFPCIATGIYGYPGLAAAHVAASMVRKHLEKNADAVDRIIFCVFLEQDEKFYQAVLQSYFPLQ